jgi:hypothetical protein
MRGLLAIVVDAGLLAVAAWLIVKPRSLTR